MDGGPRWRRGQPPNHGGGREFSPLFSPDGQWIAFTGEYDGNVDIFVMPSAGGVPRRLTYHPVRDQLAGWTPDGKSVLFVSSRQAESGRTAQLFTMAIDGVHPTPVPLPMAYEGSFSPDGARIAYVPLPRAFNAWKRYRGGMAAPVYIANLRDSSIGEDFRAPTQTTLTRCGPRVMIARSISCLTATA